MAVYFARAEGTNLVKIGYATIVQRRLVHLQAGCPYRLTLARVADGDRATEAGYHALFAEHHVDRDWFNWSPRMAVETPTAIVPPAGGSFAELIDDLGGPTVFAARTGIGINAAKKMRSRNAIAAKHWPTIQALGIPADRLLACQQRIVPPSPSAPPTASHREGV
jgi:hypothetical protein